MAEPKPYQRVDVSHLPTPFGRAVTGATAGIAGEGGGKSGDGPGGAGGVAGDGGRARSAFHIRWSVLVLSVVLCSAQMVVSTLGMHYGAIMTSTLISVMAFGALMVLVLAVNPGLRAVSAALGGRLLRPMNRAELTSVFAALLVTAGIGTFGLASPLVPMVAAPWNPEWNTAQRGWAEQVHPYLNRSLYIAAAEDMDPAERERNIELIRQFREGLQPVDADGEPMARPPEDASWAETLPYWRALFEQISWWSWIKPLSLWLIFIGACYAMFYCLAYVVMRSWVYREQLIFPLAQLPEQLLPEEGSKRWLPPTLRSGGFWIAFSVVAIVLSWNAGVSAELIPGLDRIRLSLGGDTVNPVLEGTILEGAIGGRYSLQFSIIFVAIGLAFLLPTEISFSLWFYYLMAVSTFVVLVWMGHGQSGADFPAGLYHQSNIVTAQGGGAILMFGGICLGRALSDWLRLCKDEPWPARLRMSGPVIGLVISLIVIAGWLIWNDLPVLWALCVTAILMLMTMGVMRVVAEGGVYWMQVQTGPFHLYSAFGLSGVLKGSAITALMPLYAILFLDLKTFLAPNIANAGKMHEDVGGPRTRFHLNIIVCIIISAVVAIGVSLFLAHLIGAQQMRTWFYSTMPQNLMNEGRDLVALPPDFSPANAIAYVFGAAWVMLSLFLRQFLFWFPHPIGYVMFINSLMNNLWFSFFLGWVAKKLVVTYGGKQTFEYTRPIFIGLIMGEALMILGWTIGGLWFDRTPGLSDNSANL